MATKAAQQLIETDVVVAGAGGSGLAAALAAAEAGCRVIVLEKAAAPGGTTEISVGSITVNRSALQQKQGVSDSADAHFEDMEQLAGDLRGIDNPELRRIYVDNITDTCAWLEGLGLVFDGPFEEPPHRVARMLVVLPNSAAYIKRLLRAARRHDIRILSDARVSDLIVENGAVTGVRASVGASPTSDLPVGEKNTLEVRARCGVVLATGDFSSGATLKSRLVESAVAGCNGINPLSTGDGHVLAARHGGAIRNGHLVWGPELRFARPPNPLWATRMPVWPWLIRLARSAFHVLPTSVTQRIMAQFLTSYMGPSPALFDKGAVLVDEKGQRIDTTDTSVLAQRGPDQPYWIVLDAETARQFQAWPGFISTAPGVAYAYLDDYLRMRPDVTTRQNTLDELAARLGMDGGVLESAMIGRSGAQTPTNKSDGPFYALGPVTNVIVFTDGGLAVSRDMQVLDENDTPVGGLYAAGSAGQGGLILNGHGHHIGWAFVSGRIAGRRAAGVD